MQHVVSAYSFDHLSTLPIIAMRMSTVLASGVSGTGSTLSLSFAVAVPPAAVVVPPAPALTLVSSTAASPPLTFFIFPPAFPDAGVGVARAATARVGAAAADPRDRPSLEDLSFVLRALVPCCRRKVGVLQRDEEGEGREREKEREILNLRVYFSKVF